MSDTSPPPAPVPAPPPRMPFWRRMRALAHLLLLPAAILAVLGILWGVAVWNGYTLQDLHRFLSRPVPFQAAPPDGSPDERVTWLNVLLAVLFLVLAAPTSRGVQRALSIVMAGTKRLDEGLRYSFVRVAGYVIWALAIYGGLLQIFRLEGITYVLAALSVGIGFGLQEVVSNFVSGLILLFERPFRVGDTVRVGEHEGYVRQINIRATTIETFDNIAILVPNKELMTQQVVNVRHRDPKVRAHVKVGVSYDSDVELVRDTLLVVAAAHPRVMSQPKPKVIFEAFGESSLDFDLMVWLPDPDDRKKVPSHLRFAILAAFRKAGIEIAYPQRDLHLRSMPGGGPMPLPAGRAAPAGDDGEDGAPPEQSSLPEADGDGDGGE